MASETAEKLSDRLATSLKAYDPGIDEGAVLRFNINFEPQDPTSRVYTYVALFVARRWWVSGRSETFARGGLTHVQFMTKLAEHGATDVELATTFESVRQ